MGTPALKPYMHGYFLSLKLYDAARVIANPFIHAEHREQAIKAKIEKLSESRIRTRRDAPKVNKALAEKIRRDQERELKKAERRKRHKGKDVATDTNQGDGVEQEKPSLLNDGRFKALFEDPAFEIDTSTKEYALLNPSSTDLASGLFMFSFLMTYARMQRRRRTVVEEEEDESDKVSSDSLGDSSDTNEQSESEKSEDSSDAGGEPVLRSIV